MPSCIICGARFAKQKALEEHSIAVHNFTEEESSLVRQAGKEEKARRRSRGPYRKAHTA